MTPTWKPDFEPSESLVRLLLASAFSQLQIDSLVLLGVGWDNSAFLVNRHLVFRFPRRNIAATLIENESRFLPLIAPHLPVAVPVPIYIGDRTEEYPYPFAGYEQISGRTACRAKLTDDDRSALAVPVGMFLRSLHQIQITFEIASAAPGDEIGRTDLPKRLAQLKVRVDRLGSRLNDIGADPRLLITRAEDLADAPASTSPACWVHGDLYARHLLVDNTSRLCGVIDWGDLHLGDAALDLSIGYSFLPPASRSSFFAAYGDVDVATRDRARFRALTYGVILLEYGLEIDDPPLAAAGAYALTIALQPE